MRKSARWFWVLVGLVVLLVAGGAVSVMAQPTGSPVTSYQGFWTPGVEAVFWHAMRILRCAYWTLIVCHVLLAIWVLVDIRERKQGKLLFVALTLFAGFPAAIVYALTRIADKKS